jgi:hypothetical protein
VEHDADKKAANALEHLNPFQDTSQVKFDDWKALFYGCRFKVNFYNRLFVRCLFIFNKCVMLRKIKILFFSEFIALVSFVVQGQ